MAVQETSSLPLSLAADEVGSSGTRIMSYRMTFTSGRFICTALLLTVLTAFVTASLKTSSSTMSLTEVCLTLSTSETTLSSGASEVDELPFDLVRALSG